MANSNWLQHLEDRSLWERLSPAAKAVTDAAASAQWEQDAGGMRLSDVQEIAAAALRAAADQVVPEAANAVGDQHDEARLDQWLRIRRKLLAIAAELEGSTPAT